jgi:hypothetical protein
MFLRARGSWVRFRNAIVRLHAVHHRRKQLSPMPDLLVKKLLGPRPVFDPVGDPRHRRYEQERQPHPDLPVWHAELHTDEKLLTHHASRWLLRGILVALLIVEFLGAGQLLADEGMENPQRSIVAAATACVLFFLLWIAAKLLGQREQSRWFYLVVASIALFALAIAILRHDETSVEESSGLSNWSSAIFLLFVTLGPGLLAKHVLTALLPVDQLTKNTHRLRRLITRAQRAQARAITELDRISLWQAYWDQESEQITATYLLEYRLQEPDNTYTS